MKLGKLKNSFSKLTAVEIVNKIAANKISGMWLTEIERKKAKEVCKNITEEEANNLLDEFDEARQSNYNYWAMFN